MNITNCVFAISRDGVEYNINALDLQVLVQENDGLVLQRGDHLWTHDPTTSEDNINDDDVFTVTSKDDGVTYKISGAIVKKLFLVPLDEVAPPVISGVNIDGEILTSDYGAVEGGTAPFVDEINWYSSSSEDGLTDKKKLEFGDGITQEFEHPQVKDDRPIHTKDSLAGFILGHDLYTSSAKTNKIYIGTIQKDSPEKGLVDESDINNSHSSNAFVPHELEVLSIDESNGVCVRSKLSTGEKFLVREDPDDFLDIDSGIASVINDDDYDELPESVTFAAYDHPEYPLLFRAVDGSIHKGFYKWSLYRTSIVPSRYRIQFDIYYINADGVLIRDRYNGDELSTDSWTTHYQNFKLPWFGHVGVEAKLGQLPTMSRNRHNISYNGKLVIDYLPEAINSGVASSTGSAKAGNMEFVVATPSAFRSKIYSREYNPLTFLPVEDYAVVSDPVLDEFDFFVNIHDSNLNTKEVFFLASKRQGTEEDKSTWNLISTNVETGVWKNEGSWVDTGFTHTSQIYIYAEIATVDKETIRFLLEEHDHVMSAGHPIPSDPMKDRGDFITFDRTTGTRTGSDKLREKLPNSQVWHAFRAAAKQTNFSFDHLYYHDSEVRVVKTMLIEDSIQGIGFGNNAMRQYWAKMSALAYFNPTLKQSKDNELLLTNDEVNRYVYTEVDWDDPEVPGIRLQSNTILVHEKPNFEYDPLYWTTEPTIDIDWVNQTYTSTPGVAAGGSGTIEYKIVKIHAEYYKDSGFFQPDDYNLMTNAEIFDYQTWKMVAGADGSVVETRKLCLMDSSDASSMRLRFNASGNGILNGVNWTGKGNRTFSMLKTPELLSIVNANSTFTFKHVGLNSSYHQRFTHKNFDFLSPPSSGSIEITDHREESLPVSLSVTFEAYDAYSSIQRILTYEAPDGNMELVKTVLFD